MEQKNCLRDQTMGVRALDFYFSSVMSSTHPLIECQRQFCSLSNATVPK